MKRIVFPVVLAALFVGMAVAVNTANRTSQNSQVADAPPNANQRAQTSSDGAPSTALKDTDSKEMIDLQRSVHIDMYTDFSCPWCYIGAEHMSALLARYDFSENVRVQHRAYLLAPNTPEEGVNIADNLRQKYGREPEEMFARVESVAQNAGVPLDYSKLERNNPTLRAHALTLAAADKGTQDTLKRDLFRANFVDARNIHDVDVLIDIGQAHGFTADEVREIVTNPENIDAVRSQAHAATRVARGVPYFVINDDRAFSGAQPEDALLEQIQQAGN